MINRLKIIYFSNGYRLGYVYRSDGVKLREIRQYPAFNPATGRRKTDNIYYFGPYEQQKSNLHRLNLPGGYITLGDSVYHHYLPDYQGNILGVINTRTRQVEQRTDYYPYGMPHGNASGAGLNSRKYSGKELITFAGYDAMDYHARWRPTSLPLFTTSDPMGEKYYPLSLYAYCGGDPVNRTDENGEAWRPIKDEKTGKYTGFDWISSEESYNSEGALLPGLYEQAIFFSEGGRNGKFDSKERKNIGTSTAYIYLYDGSMSTTRYDACTYPSDKEKYATIPAGLYEAKVGLHKRDYPALRLSDVGTKNFYANQIVTSTKNPHTGEYRISGANIHKPGKKNITGMINPDMPISMACLLIDINKWDKFIEIFNTDKQRNNIIGVIVSRNLKAPEY